MIILASCKPSRRAAGHAGVNLFYCSKEHASISPGRSCTGHDKEVGDFLMSATFFAGR